MPGSVDPSASSMTMTSPLHMANPQANAFPLPRSVWVTTRTSGRSARATAMVWSVECPSTRITSTMNSGSAASTYGRLSASLSAGITTLTRGPTFTLAWRRGGAEDLPDSIRRIPQYGKWTYSTLSPPAARDMARGDAPSFLSSTVIRASGEAVISSVIGRSGGRNYPRDPHESVSPHHRIRTRSASPPSDPDELTPPRRAA
jgi:hypothetical protein